MGTERTTDGWVRFAPRLAGGWPPHGTLTMDVSRVPAKCGLVGGCGVRDNSQLALLDLKSILVECALGPLTTHLTR